MLCVSLESPHRGDSNEYTQYSTFNMRSHIKTYSKSVAMRFFSQRIQERVRNNRGKHVSIRATEVLI